MSWPPANSVGRVGRWRRAGVVALAAFALADGLLVAKAVTHTGALDQDALQAQTRTIEATGKAAAQPAPAATALPHTTGGSAPTSLALTASSSPAAVAAYGTCADGTVRVGGDLVKDVTVVRAVTAEAMVGQDRSCAAHLWRRAGGAWARVGATVPGGPAGASASTLWVLGTKAGAPAVVTNATGTIVARPRVPCVAPATPTAVAVTTTKQAAVFCTRPATAAGQVRLVYGTTEGGTTWAEYAGARAVGPGAKGRVDGLDGDGRLVAAAGLGGDAVGVLLADVGADCAGLQLRISTDRGRNWKAGGCVTDVPAGGPAALGGELSRVVVAGVRGGALVTMVSTDRGAAWSAA